MDNNAKSSFNIDFTKAGSFWHNFRRGFLAKDVRGDLSFQNEYTCSFEEARRLAKQMKIDADIAYLRRRGQKPRYDPEKIYWSAEVNAREWHTIEDLKRAAEVIEKEMGYRLIYGCLHKDEGHLNDDGEWVMNCHFHLEFISLDENGISRHRKTFSPSLMSKIQTKIANVLNMERGISKEITGRTHLPPKQYKQAMKMQEPLKQELKLAKADLADAKKTIKELEKALKEANLAARADLQEQGASRGDYAALEAENRKLKDDLAELKKMPDLDNLEDFSKIFKEKIERLRRHPKLDDEVEKVVSGSLRSTLLGDFKKEDVLAYIADAVATKQAAINTIKEAQVTLKEVAVKKEISVKAQLMAVRENKTLGGFLGAVGRSDADVAVLRREKAELVDTVDQLQKQNKALQKTLKATSEIVVQKDAQIAELQKNQEGLKLANDSFCLGQASMLAELVSSGKLCIEPKGQSLLAGLNDYMGGGYSTDYFAGIKSGLLSYTLRVNQPENGLKL
ncbi:mobilization protein [Campylobacter showae]|uniref:mobilization protein n=1 Tax=Campylobacter showae TaxID=204 RepID=UPI003C6EE68F